MKRKVYYGWVNVAIGALAMVGTLPGRTQGLGLVTEPLLADLRIDRVTYATLNLWATLIGALFCLPCGKLVDRWGSRVVLTGVSLALGATVLTMSSVTSLAMLAVTLVLTRGFGQSALSVVSLTLVGKWFARRLNMAMAVYSLLVGFAFIAAFPSVGAAVQRFGWRTAWAGVAWFLLGPPVSVFSIWARNTPESNEAGMGGGAEALSTIGFTVWEALRTPAFWVFALSSSLFGLVYSGIALFNESILKEHGFGPRVYYNVLVLSTLLGLAANFLGGWLASRWRIERLMGAGMAALALALMGLPLVRTETHAMLYGVVMGVAGGIVTVVFFSVWGQIFGRAHLGRIQGCAQMMTVFASAVGPLLLAETLRRTGSYDEMFWLLAGIVAVLGLAAWIVPMPVSSWENDIRCARGRGPAGSWPWNRQ